MHVKHNYNTTVKIVNIVIGNNKNDYLVSSYYGLNKQLKHSILLLAYYVTKTYKGGVLRS